MCHLLQGLGVSANTAQRILDKSKAKSPTFIAQGPVQQLESERPSLPVERTKLTHRFALKNNTFCEWALVTACGTNTLCGAVCYNA